MNSRCCTFPPGYPSQHSWALTPIPAAPGTATPLRVLRGAPGCCWSSTCVLRAASVQGVPLPARCGSSSPPRDPKPCSPRSSDCSQGSLLDSAASASPKSSLAAQQEEPEGASPAWQGSSLPLSASSPGGTARVPPAPAGTRLCHSPACPGEERNPPA